MSNSQRSQVKRSAITKIQAAAIIVMIAIAGLGARATSIGGSSHGQLGGPRYGGVLVAGTSIEPKTLNFNLRMDPAAHYADNLMRNTLVYTSLESGEIGPALAYKWDVSQDARLFTFYLYRNVTWHDGARFTSADVKYTFDQIIKEKGASYGYLKGVQKTETPDEYTFRATLQEPNAAFLANMGIQYAPWILPKHLYEGTDWFTNLLCRITVYFWSGR